MMTPIEALKAYRNKSPIELIEDAELFKKLPIADQSELLFYMIAHQANQLNIVSDKVGESCDEMQPVVQQ